jgi:hypothetical protein
MQGGCTCENCSYLRIGTGNIEFAALAAPRPLGMTAADDWTKELQSKGLPELERHYAMLGAPKAVMAKVLTQFPHNYNYVSRAIMYRFMNDSLKLGLENPIVEEDFKPLSIPEMTVWDADHPRPAGGPEFERSLLRWITKDSVRQMKALTPTDEKSLAEFRRVVGGAFDVMLGRRDRLGTLASSKLRSIERSECNIQLFEIDSGCGKQLPAILLKPKQWDKRLVIWAHGNGKAGLFDGETLRPAVKKLLDSGAAVVGVDLLYQGEFLSRSGDKPLNSTRRVANSRDYAGFTFGYNYPLFSERVQDLLAVIGLMTESPTTGHASQIDRPEKLYLIGTGGAGPIAAAAGAQAGAIVDRLAIDTEQFRFANLTSIDDPNFLPGAAKYGDLVAMLALSAPHDLWIAGESPNGLTLVQAAYGASGDEKRLTIDDGGSEAAESRAVDWLLRP